MQEWLYYAFLTAHTLLYHTAMPAFASQQGEYTRARNLGLICVSVSSAYLLTVVVSLHRLMDSFNCGVYLLSSFLMPSLVVMPYYLRAYDLLFRSRMDYLQPTAEEHIAAKWYRDHDVLRAPWVLHSVLGAVVLFTLALGAVALSLRPGGLADLAESKCALGVEVYFFIGMVVVYVVLGVAFVLLLQSAARDICYIRREIYLFLAAAVLLVVPFVMLNALDLWYVWVDSIVRVDTLILLFNLTPLLISVAGPLALLGDGVLRRAVEKVACSPLRRLDRTQFPLDDMSPTEEDSESLAAPEDEYVRAANDQTRCVRFMRKFFHIQRDWPSSPKEWVYENVIHGLAIAPQVRKVVLDTGFIDYVDAYVDLVVFRLTWGFSGDGVDPEHRARALINRYFSYEYSAPLAFPTSTLRDAVSRGNAGPYGPDMFLQAERQLFALLHEVVLPEVMRTPLFTCIKQATRDLSESRTSRHGPDERA